MAAGIGGRGFTLFSDASMRWSSGSRQSGYVVLRVGVPSGRTLTLATLPAAATEYRDGTPTTGDALYCYVVVALGPSGLLGVSDLLCLGAGADGGLESFNLQLNESTTATLTWAAPTVAAGHDGYRLLVLGAGGPASPAISLGPTATTYTYSIGGTVACYELTATRGGTTVATARILCGVPGVATVGTAGVHGQQATADAVTRWLKSPVKSN